MLSLNYYNSLFSVYQGEDQIPGVTSQEMDYFDKYGITGEDGEEMDGELDTEANLLYEWTQTLNLNDDFISTPGPVSAAH